MSRDTIGIKNAGFTIFDEVRTGIESGYALGKSELNYVTWWYKVRSTTVDFYHGHYIPIDHDAPMKSQAKAYADLHRRAADDFERMSRYGYWGGRK